MDEITKLVRDYVIREYLEEGDDREITETTPLISGGFWIRSRWCRSSASWKRSATFRFPTPVLRLTPSIPCRALLRWYIGFRRHKPLPCEDAVAPDKHVRNRSRLRLGH